MIKFKVLITALIATTSSVVISQINKEVFNKEFQVKGEIILKTEYEVLVTDVIDTFLLATMRTNDYYFTVYNAKTEEEIMKIARIGDGPGEFRFGGTYTRQFEIINDDLYIWLYENNKNKLHRINITESIKKNKTIVDKVVKHSPDCGFADVFYIEPSMLIGRTSNLNPKMNRLQIYDLTNKYLIKTVLPFPKIKNENDDINFLAYRYNPIYNAVLTLKPDKTKIASVMIMFNRIDIFDIKGEIINSYIDKDNTSRNQFEDYLQVSQHNLNKTTVKNYYEGSYGSNNYIYALYVNRLQSIDYKKSTPVEIRIFNWKAEPVCIIKVPDYLQYISIDETNGIMYGSAVHDEKILKYDIKDILDEIK